MSKLYVANGPLTSRIYVGRVLKDGITWAEGKQDLTAEVCAAVALHVLETKNPLIVTFRGKPKYEISVREL